MSLGLMTGSGQPGNPWARTHRISFSSLLRAAASCASVNGSCGGACFAQALRVAFQDEPCSCARMGL